MSKLRMPSYAPSAKVQAAGYAGAIATVLLWVLAQFGVEMDAETAVAFATLIMFAAAYLKRPNANDQPQAEGEKPEDPTR